MNIGIIGTRRRDTSIEYKKMEMAFFEVYHAGDIIISGGCPKGGDKFALTIAVKFHISMTTHYPDWSLGKHAGFLRNTLIAKDCDFLIACVAGDRTGGTEDIIAKFLKEHTIESLKII